MSDTQPRDESPRAPRPRPGPPAAEPEVATDVTISDSEGEPGVGAPEPSRQHRRRYERRAEARMRRRRLRLTFLVIIVLAVVAGATLVTVRALRSDGSSTSSNSATEALASITDGDAANAFVAGASSDIVAVTSYDYRSLDTALSNGEAVTTGAYRTSFRASLSGALGREVARVHRVQTFAVLKAGIGTIAADGDSAKVLIFGVQSVTDDTTRGKARRLVVTLTATMARQGNRYLVRELAAGANAGLPDGTNGLRAAAEAGREQVAAALTLRHDHFTANFDHALSGAVDPLRSSLSAQAARSRKQVVGGRYDLSGTVTAVAVEQAAGDTLVLLAAATGTRTNADGKTSVVVDGRYEVTVVRVGGIWRTSSLNAVTAS